MLARKGTENRNKGTDFACSVGGKEDVGWLQISVDDAAIVLHS